MYLKPPCSLLFFPVPFQRLVLTMDVPTPAVRLAWWDTAVLPVQCPAPTSVVERPVIPQHPASQVSRSRKAQEEIWIFYFEMNIDICTVNIEISLISFFSYNPVSIFRLLVSRGPGDEPQPAVCVTRGVCVWGGRCALLAGPADEGGLWDLYLWERKASELPAQSRLLRWVCQIHKIRCFISRSTSESKGNFYSHSRHHSSSALMFQQSYTLTFVFL